MQVLLQGFLRGFGLDGGIGKTYFRHAVLDKT